VILRIFLSLVYQGLKLLVQLYQLVYFPFTTFRHRERLDFEGPGIIVSNHPNTMVDPLHVVSRTPRQIFFLANASMFKNRVAGFLLNHLYCIPIKRPGKDEGNKLTKVNNYESFRRSYEHLAQGGCLFIAPEGGSELERRLRPIKTGTARIALGAEAANGFQLGLHIYPVGLTYEHPTQCGSRLYMEAGSALRVADWQAAYEADPIAAVRDLTAYLEREMQTLILHTADETQDQLLYRLQSILQNDAPLPVAAHYDRTRLLLQRLQAEAEDNPAGYANLVAKAATYRSQLKAAGLRDRGVSQAAKPLLSLPVLLGWPLWLYGRVNNFFAYEIPRLIERKMGLYIGYRTTVKVVSGTFFSFPVFYTLQYLLARYLLPAPWPLLYLVSLPVSGILAWAYARHFQPRWEAYRWRQWQRQHPAAAADILAQRCELTAFVRGGE